MRMTPDNIRQLRTHLGLNRAALGALIGVSGRTVEKYELGTVLPSRSVILHLDQLQQWASTTTLETPGPRNNV